VGIFDWLFGKKKDRYGGTRPATDYGRTPARDYAKPPDPARFDQAELREINLSFRKARSREPVHARRDQTIHGNNPMTGEKAAGPLAHLGGTREHPDPYTDTEKLRAQNLPLIASLDDLAELLGSRRDELVFLASGPSLSEPSHYTLKQIGKKAGGTRALMVPMPRLKAVQRALNEKLIRRLPVHEGAHGFRKGRDVLTGAAPHVGKDVVISVDISEFFPSFTFRRVAGYFRTLGYGRGIATALANLTTARLRDASLKIDGKWRWATVHAHPDAARRYHPELPQGAPTSPGLANAISRRMDKRLAALAGKFGADYTRYADDLTFSGNDELAAKAGNLLALVRQITRTEGLALNEAKTRIMRKGRQQRVTGVVVNTKTNVSRAEYDRLKAILHNSIKHGPAGQNRENVPDFKEHLRGRIAHVSHIGPERGAKLMRMFEQIRW